MQPQPTMKRASTDGSRSSACDLLSALPDGILHIILSFLPARQAVQTIVLSWRWRDLWCLMPCINIDEQEFSVSANVQILENWDKFENFTTNFLSNHCNSVSLDKFRIYAHAVNNQLLDRWIRLGIKYLPSELDIAIDYNNLRGGHRLFIFPDLTSSSFCHLKNLILSNVVLHTHFTKLICCSCPALVELQLIDCYNRFQELTPATLMKLVIDSCLDLNSSVEILPMVITTPNILSLKLNIQGGLCQNGISISNDTFPVKASVHYMECDEFELHAEIRRDLLSALNNVKALDLSHFDTLAMLHEQSDNFPLFPNMCALSLESCLLDDERHLDSRLEDLGSFLENAPCLEKLTFRHTLVSVSPEVEWDIKGKSVSLQGQDGKTFRCSKLKLIEVFYKHDCDRLLIELLWRLGRKLPDARIVLTKI